MFTSFCCFWSRISFLFTLKGKFLMSLDLKLISGRLPHLPFGHKVRTYKEYHSECPSSELGLSQPLSRVFPSPQKHGGGGTLACGWGVGGSPNSDEGHTLWYSLYVRTLCIWPCCTLLNTFHDEIIYTRAVPKIRRTIKGLKFLKFLSANRFSVVDLPSRQPLTNYIQHRRQCT
jgi:hypothetical protein